MQVFTPEECLEIVREFDHSSNKKDESGEPFYFNSQGIGNLQSTLKHVDRITEKLSSKYPGIKFSNTYTRQYNRGSFLGLHTDRVGLDLTLSVCIEKKTPRAWPLHVSQTTWGGDWRPVADESRYKRQYDSYDMSEGIGSVCEGRKYPHWRDEFLCAEDERAVFVFYHWTAPKRVFRPSFSVNLPKVAVYDNFLSKTECQLLINTAEGKLSRSTVVDDKTGQFVQNPNRTSRGMFFEIGENPVIEEIEKRIADLTNIPVVNGEGLQVLKYEPGQEYRPHFDYFDPSHPALKDDVGNNRVATVLMYLNTPEEGGATTFPDAGISIEAKQGSAVVFLYPDPVPESKTLHAGTPVVSGEKWVATKWLRKMEY